MSSDDRPPSPSPIPFSLGSTRPLDTINAKAPHGSQPPLNDTFPAVSTSLGGQEYRIKPSQSPQVLDWTGFNDSRRRIDPTGSFSNRGGNQDDLPVPAPDDDLPTHGWNVLAHRDTNNQNNRMSTATTAPVVRKVLDPTFDPATAPPYISIASAPKSIYSSTPVGPGPEKTDQRLVSLMEENETLRQNLQIEKTAHQEFAGRKELERENVARYVRTLEDKVAALEMQVTRSHVEGEHNRLQQSQNEMRMEKTAEVIQALREQLVLSEKRATDYQTQATTLRRQLTDSENRERRYREEVDVERRSAEKRAQQVKEMSERREQQLKDAFEQHKAALRSSQDQRERVLKESSSTDREKLSQTLKDERENSRGLMAELKHLREATSALQADVARAEAEREAERERVREVEGAQGREQAEYKAKLKDAIETLAELQGEYRLACELNAELRQTATSAHEDNEILIRRLQQRTDQLLDMGHPAQPPDDAGSEELSRQIENLRSENAALVQLVESLQTNHHHQLQQRNLKVRDWARSAPEAESQPADMGRPDVAGFSGVPIADISGRFSFSASDSAGDSFPRVLPARSPPQSALAPPDALGLGPEADFASREIAAAPGFEETRDAELLMSGPLPPNDPEPFRVAAPALITVTQPVAPGPASASGLGGSAGSGWLADDGMPGTGPPPSASGALTVDKLEGWGDDLLEPGPASEANVKAAPPAIIPIKQNQGIMHQLLSSLNRAPPTGAGPGQPALGLGDSSSSFGGPGPLLAGGGASASGASSSGSQHGGFGQGGGGYGGSGAGYYVGGPGGGRGGRETEQLALMEKSAMEVMQAGYDPESVIGV